MVVYTSNVTLPDLPSMTWRLQLACHRAALGLTKAKLSSQCGLSRALLYRLESGEQEPTLAQDLAISAAIEAAYSRRCPICETDVGAPVDVKTEGPHRCPRCDATWEPRGPVLSVKACYRVDAD